MELAKHVNNTMTVCDAKVQKNSDYRENVMYSGYVFAHYYYVSVYK